MRSKKDIFIFILMGCTAVLITVTAIHNKQDFLQILLSSLDIVKLLCHFQIPFFVGMHGDCHSPKRLVVSSFVENQFTILLLYLLLSSVRS